MAFLEVRTAARTILYALTPQRGEGATKAETRSKRGEVAARPGRHMVTYASGAGVSAAVAVVAVVVVAAVT